MEEIEVPTEHLHETLHEKAHHPGHGGGGHEGAGVGLAWAGRAALSSALVAVLAAISALLAGHHANEAMIDQMRATDNWAYFQAKGIKASILRTKDETLTALGKEPAHTEQEQVEKYEKQQEDIQKEAKEEEASSAKHLASHNLLARVVTIYQVGIALAAIAVLSRRQWLWFMSLALGALGTVLFALALVG